MTTELDSHGKAFLQGWDAYEAGKTIEAAEEVSPDVREDWIAGWREAEASAR